MKVYKRSVFKFMLSLLSIFVFPPILFIILYTIWGNIWFCGLISLACFLVLLFIILLDENIRFELYEDGKFRYYVANKLKKEYFLQADTYLSCKIVSGNKSETEISLYINDDSIDASPLGAYKFDLMYTDMQTFIEKKPIKLN